MDAGNTHPGDGQVAEPVDGLVAELREFNRALDRRRRASGTVLERRRLALQVGSIEALHRLGNQEIRSFFNGSGMVGVDGSLSTCGASFPYTVSLFRALARSTRPGTTSPGTAGPGTARPGKAGAGTSGAGAAGERFWAYRLFSPLLSPHRDRIQALIEQGLDPEDALAHMRWEILASLEAEVGQAALEREQFRLLLWDGGFARLETHAAAVWEQLQDRALRQGAIMLGVTEEIATRALAPLRPPDRMGTHPGDGREAVGPVVAAGQGMAADRSAEGRGEPLPGSAALHRRTIPDQGVVDDRELLYGILQPGEVFRSPARPGQTAKWGRVYTRLARHPQVIAVDYLLEQADELEAALSWLYTITPSHGRGFPLWLDMVDSEVRITGEQTEALLASCLDPALQELFLRPLRLRRQF